MAQTSVLVRLAEWQHARERGGTWAPARTRRWVELVVVTEESRKSTPRTFRLPTRREILAGDPSEGVPSFRTPHAAKPMRLGAVELHVARRHVILAEHGGPSAWCTLDATRGNYAGGNAHYVWVTFGDLRLCAETPGAGPVPNYYGHRFSDACAATLRRRDVRAAVAAFAAAQGGGTEPFPLVLYHGTADANLAGITSRGLLPSATGMFGNAVSLATFFGASRYARWDSAYATRDGGCVLRCVCFPRKGAVFNIGKNTRPLASATMRARLASKNAKERWFARRTATLCDHDGQWMRLRDAGYDALRLPPTFVGWRPEDATLVDADAAPAEPEWMPEKRGRDGTRRGRAAPREGRDGRVYAPVWMARNEEWAFRAEADAVLPLQYAHINPRSTSTNWDAWWRDTFVI